MFILRAFLFSFFLSHFDFDSSRVAFERPSSARRGGDKKARFFLRWYETFFAYPSN